jgi:hypothetical protein
MVSEEQPMQILSLTLVVTLAGIAAVACGGSSIPAAETNPNETQGVGESSAVAIADGAGSSDAHQQVEDEPSGDAEDPVASGPAAEDDCMAFHVKMIECLEAEGGSDLGASEEAEMRRAAQDGCRDAYADRGNPVTGYIIELWSKCRQLSCAEIEGCFLSGMMTLSAPPGPYVPSLQ